MQAYFTFNGNCRQAMTFYRKCLGGELTFQTVTQIKKGEPVPAPLKNVIVHACLKTKFFVLQGTDLMEERPLQKGNNISLILECGSRAEIKKYFTKLSQNGKRNVEPMVTSHGALLASVTDQFGMQWLLNFQQQK
jgi:PhnB protein